MQARMGSTRLPGKILRDLDGTPLLGHLLERLARAVELDVVVVATSDEAGDDAVESFCRTAGTACHRGPADDVAERVRGAVAAFGLETFVRISGDSPLLDPALVDRAVTLRRERGSDVVTNVFPRSFPAGQSVEAIRVEAFERACAEMDEASDREHVTPFFYRHADEFTIYNFTAERNYGDLRLVVDTADDLERIAGIMRRMTRPSWDYGLDEIAELAR